MLRIPYGLKMTSVNAKNIISSVMLDTLPCLLAYVRNSPLMTGKASRQNINISFLSSNNSIRVCFHESMQAHAVQFEILPLTSLCAGYWCSVSVFTIQKSVEFPVFQIFLNLCSKPLLPNKQTYLLLVNIQRDAQVLWNIYLFNLFLYMFRALRAHPQEDLTCATHFLVSVLSVKQRNGLGMQSQ